VPSLINELPPPGVKIVRTKLNRQWAQKVSRAYWEQDESLDIEEIERADKASEAASNYVATVAYILTRLVGRDRAALMLYDLARVLATPGRRGRPLGSSKKRTSAELFALRSSVLMRDDGSDLGRRRAIAEALANEPLDDRPAFRKHLHSHLPPLRQGIISEKNRT
jgi:hypothetical protein